MSINTAPVKSYLLDLQHRLCEALSQEDAKATFHEDLWQRKEGGGGSTRVIENGNVFEKGAINISHVFGENLPPSATSNRPELTQCEFEAMGISMIFHPNNPFVPTMHTNLRLFHANTKTKGPIWWFGGGMDLTPYYGFEEDCKHWHRVIKAACDTFGKNTYKEYKKWCDEYFYLKHRQEPRGIGGIFFDDLNTGDFDKCFAFIKSVGDCIQSAYQPNLI
jgi:coproporphyrinogen III oxidase